VVRLHGQEAGALRFRQFFEALRPSGSFTLGFVWARVRAQHRAHGATTVLLLQPTRPRTRALSHADEEE
jgi:hypothetical protein